MHSLIHALTFIIIDQGETLATVKPIHLVVLKR